MTKFEIIELVALFLVIAPSYLSGRLAKERKDIRRLMIGTLFIACSFLFSNLEAFFFPEVFDFLEHLFMLFAAIFITAALILELRRKYPNQQKSTSKPKIMEGMK